MGKQLFLQSEEGKKKQVEMLEYAKDSILKFLPLGTEISYDNTSISFLWKGSKITHYAYTGWHTGKTIKDGRGLQNLLNQLNP